ncbi:AraC family transcriptional regulator [Pseudoalteromonas denitrificans]|uniref:AraC-type DNA-binding protein n=1 Tax=Pseudoalteromonas denitrificans DSM 6059 TaxID=1123010 RepID=A0A1I1Q9H9_9GAMM|nr:AraC family transcriptional regulator [Pseudoalteromonas denitrificans]SFD18647.1 AraC-type DNA-binding protein [Pseudoalteromonas denitrificans DSM 6059]
MSLVHHSISIHFVITLIKAAKRKGLDYELLLQKANLNPHMLTNSQLRITPNQFSKLMRELWIMGDDDFLGLAKQKCRHGVFTLMAKQAANCPNLESIFRHMCHFYNLITDSIRLDFKLEGDLAYLSMKVIDPGLDPDFSLHEFLMLVWHRFPSWLIGQHLPLKAILLTYEQPKHVGEYRLMYPCPASFAQDSNTLIFEARHLKMPVVQTSNALRSYLRRSPIDWFTRQAYYQVFTQRVVSYLENSEQLALTSMDDIAKQFHVTTRTLRRKLNDEGTRFQTLKDNVRRDTAIHYLSQPNVPIAQIARELGFSEPAAFTRAFKLWTGVSPKIYRASPKR